MRALFGLWIGACVVWAQDTLWTEAHTKGDFVEVWHFWRSQPSEVPLGANFVLKVSPASALGWDSLAVLARGARDAVHSPLYLPTYLTQRVEGGDVYRVSYNLLASTPPAGLPFAAQRELAGSWRIPILRFGDTLHLQWAMETGEIVLAPFVRAKTRFVTLPIAPVYLCPSVAPASISIEGSILRVQLPGEFRPENLTITWYRNDLPVGQGATYPPLLPGNYWAEVRHVCGSSARTDTLAWLSTSTGAHLQGSWRVYPQPAIGEVWIEVPYSGPVQVQLYDLAGRVVYETAYEANARQPYLLTLPASLSAGLYRLSLENAGETFSAPFSYAR